MVPRHAARLVEKNPDPAAAGRPCAPVRQYVCAPPQAPRPASPPAPSHLCRSQPNQQRRPWAAGPGRAAPPDETIPPSIQILARHLKLTRQAAHVLARQHPADDADLELSAEDTVG